MSFQAPISQVYFEDLDVPSRYTSAARTITEADVVAFAGLSGDHNSLHTDEEFAATTPFGGRIAHGLSILSIASGLTTRLPIMQELGPSLLGLVSVTSRWPAPTKIGDTIHVELSFIDKSSTRSGRRGIVTERRLAYNQTGATVLDSEWKLLVAGRETRAQS